MQTGHWTTEKCYCCSWLQINTVRLH